MSYTAPLSRTWGWSVSHDDVADVVRTLEPVIGRSHPDHLKREEYIVSGSADDISLDGELETAIGLAGVPRSISVQYRDTRDPFALWPLTVTMKVGKRDSDTYVDLSIFGLGTEATANSIEALRLGVDNEISRLGWKISGPEVVKAVNAPAPPPSAPGPPANADPETHEPAKRKGFWESTVGKFVVDHVFGTLFLGAVAGLIVLAVTLAVTSDDPTGDNNSAGSLPPSTTATTTTQPEPRPAEPQRLEDGRIVLGSSREFFGGDLRVGLISSYEGFSLFTMSTRTLTCDTRGISVGKFVDVAGEAGGRPTYFRLTVLNKADGVADVLVEDLPEAYWRGLPVPEFAECPR